MIYIISMIRSDSTRIMHYRGFDTCSESVILMGPDLIKDLIENTSIKIENATILDNNIIISKWIKEIHTISEEIVDDKVVNRHYGAKHIIIGKIDSGYKVVDYMGKVAVVYEQEEIKELVKIGSTANCRIIASIDGEKLETIGVHNIQRDVAFETLIAAKYSRFIAKTKMLGFGAVTFDYIIENSEVKLKKYTGTSQDIILPPFITVIMKDAFRIKGIKNLKLSEGLKIIGTHSFACSGVERVEIPSTVELICEGAFYGNDKLFNSGCNINTDRFKLRNNKTIILRN